jgi:hypothetical protein
LNVVKAAGRRTPWDKVTRRQNPSIQGVTVICRSADEGSQIKQIQRQKQKIYER